MYVCTVSVRIPRLYGLLLVPQRAQDVPQINICVDCEEMCVSETVELLPAQTQFYLRVRARVRGVSVC